MRKYFFIVLMGCMLTGTGMAFCKPAAPALRDNFSYYTVKLKGEVEIDSIAVHKRDREMLIFSGKKLIKIYLICLGTNPQGRKEVSGDGKTPEGHYYTTYLNPYSRFHKSFGISYPNAEDIRNAKKLGKSAGGDIMVHGLPNCDANAGPDRYRNDWTLGCIALRNEEIDELFPRINPGTPIVITP